MENKIDDLEKRVNQYNTLSLPGQPMGCHMGTSYLINDLWREVKRLRAASQPDVQADKDKDALEVKPKDRFLNF